MGLDKGRVVARIAHLLNTCDMGELGREFESLANDIEQGNFDEPIQQSQSIGLDKKRACDLISWWVSYFQRPPATETSATALNDILRKLESGNYDIAFSEPTQDQPIHSDFLKIANAITETAESMGHHWDNDSFKINDWIPRWRALAKLIETSGAKAMDLWSSGAKIHREDSRPSQPQGVSDEPNQPLHPLTIDGKVTQVGINPETNSEICVAVYSNGKEYRASVIRSPRITNDFDCEKLFGKKVKLIKRYYDPGYMLKVTPEMLEDPDTDDLGGIECLKEQSERMLEEIEEHNRKFNPNAKLGTAEIKFEPMGVRNGNIRYGRVRKPTDDAFDPLQQPFLVQDKQGQEWKAWMVGSGEVSPISQDVVCHFDGQRYVFQFHGVAVGQHGYAMKIEPDAIVLGKFSDAVGYGPDHS